MEVVAGMECTEEGSVAAHPGPRRLAATCGEARWPTRGTQCTVVSDGECQRGQRGGWGTCLPTSAEADSTLSS